MNALTEVQRARHRELSDILRPAATGVGEIHHGYEVTFAVTPGIESCIGEFMELELRCCPFFSLESDVSPDGRQALLRITGPDGVKPFIRMEFGIPETNAPPRDARSAR